MSVENPSQRLKGYLRTVGAIGTALVSSSPAVAAAPIHSNKNKAVIAAMAQREVKTLGTLVLQGPARTAPFVKIRGSDGRTMDMVRRHIDVPGSAVNTSGHSAYDLLVVTPQLPNGTPDINNAQRVKISASTAGDSVSPARTLASLDLTETKPGEVAFTGQYAYGILGGEIVQTIVHASTIPRPHSALLTQGEVNAIGHQAGKIIKEASVPYAPDPEGPAISPAAGSVTVPFRSHP